MKSLSYIVFLFMPLLANMAVADSCSSWGCTSKVSTLYITSYGTIRVGTPYDEKLANCTPASDVYFTLDTDTKNSDEIYSALLAAMMSDKRVTIRISEGSSNCAISYVKLESGV